MSLGYIIRNGADLVVNFPAQASHRRIQLRWHSSGLVGQLQAFQLLHHRWRDWAESVAWSREPNFNLIRLRRTCPLRKLAAAIEAPAP